MEMNNTIKQRFVIPIPDGLHLRPASRLAKTADSFESSVTVWCNGSQAEAKSALSMILLEASYGNEVTVTAKGCDAVNAMAAITELFEVGFKYGYTQFSQSGSYKIISVIKE
jgi:phosphotransferase system HPr (HPr) family protein